MTLGGVISQIERANPMLAASRASARAARARVGPATALPDPRVQLGVMNRMLPRLATDDPLAMDQLQVMQMLPLASRRANVRAVSALVDVADAGITTQRMDVRREAAIMLADWWQADAARAVMDETRGLLRESEAAASAMYRAGQARQADVLRAQAEQTRMTVEWMSMDAMRRSAAAGLSAMLDIAVDPDTMRVELPSVVGGASDGSTASNPDVVAAQRRVDATVASEHVAQRERWPELEVGMQLGRRPGAGDQMISFMAGVSLPIFAKQRQLQMVEESAAMRQMAEADARGALAASNAALREAMSTLERSRALQRLYDSTLLPQLNAVRESADAAYRSGTGAIDATLDALMAVNVARIAQITARADEARAVARLERLTGRAWFAVPLLPEQRP